MPIDRPSDLPDDERPATENAGRAADEWRAAEDSQAPGGRRPSPAVQASEQPQPSADGRPDDRGQPSADGPAGGSEQRNPGDQQGDAEDRALDTQPVDEARPEASAATAEAPDQPEAATAEPRTRQEHADIHPTGRRCDLGLDEIRIDALSEESAPDSSPNRPVDENESPTEEPRPVEGPGQQTDADAKTALEPSDEDELSASADLFNDVPDGQPEPIPDCEATDGTGEGDERSLDQHPRSDEPAIESDMRPLTDKEWIEHVEQVVEGLDKASAAGLETNQLHTVSPDHREWNVERNRLQGILVSDLYAKSQDVPCDGKALIAGGLGGAGKTTILTEHAGIDLSQYLVINPDNIKKEMALRGMITEVEGLSPMEASELAHEEASYIAKRLAVRAMADKRNVIWDITMSSTDSTEERIAGLRDAGYTKVDGLFVDIPIETSIRRMQVRHREGHENYRAGKGLGGRYVPPKVTLCRKDPEWSSQNRRTYEAVKPRFDNWTLYDNSVDDQRPSLVESNAYRATNREKRSHDQ